MATTCRPCRRAGRRRWCAAANWRSSGAGWAAARPRQNRPSVLHAMSYDPPTLKLPQRQSLEKQTAEALRAEIAKGTWRDLLPGERSLCDMLQISRHTLRAALGQLRRDGLISAEQGVGNRIVAGAVRPESKRLA